MFQAAKIIIADAPLRWQDVVAVARQGAVLELSGQAWARIDNARSEEHTSELQSRLHLVCRLLLEKKNKKIKQKQILASNI